MRVLRGLFVFLLAAGFLFGCSGGVSAPKVSDGPDTTILYEVVEDGKVMAAKLEGSDIAIANRPSDQQNPHVIYLPDKNLWFTVYEDWSNITNSADIRGRFVTSSGTICGGEVILTNTTGNQTAPWAAYREGSPFANTIDQITVTWQDTRGTVAGGYVYVRPINVSAINNATCAGYTIGAEQAVGFNKIESYDNPVFVNTVPNEQLGPGNGATTIFSLFLKHKDIKPGSLLINGLSAFGKLTVLDDGTGTLIGTNDSKGTLNFNSGAVKIEFANAISNAQIINATYQHYLKLPITSSPLAKDTLKSRLMPRIAYDSIGDKFIITWTETRTTYPYSSEICFKDAKALVVNFEYSSDASSSFPGYVVLNASTVSETTSFLGNQGADIMRRDKIGSVYDGIGAGGNTNLFEDYNDVFYSETLNHLVETASTSKDNLFVFQGKANNTGFSCACKDKNGNEKCDYWEEVTITDKVISPTDTAVKIKYTFKPEGFRGFDTLSLSGNAYYPSAVFDPITKRFLIVWEEQADSTSAPKIKGQLLLAGAAFYGSNFKIGEDTFNAAASKQTRPHAAFDSVNQRFYVAWQDARNSSISLENLDVYGQYIDAEGTLRGSNFTISLEPGSQYSPTSAYNSQNNTFLTVWKDGRNFTSNGSDVFGQRFSLGMPQLAILKPDVDEPLSPSILDFSTVTANQFTTQSFRMKNTGDTVLNVDCMSPFPLAPFSFPNLPTQLNACNDGNTISLVPSGETFLTVKFAPISNGTFLSNFTIKSDAGNRSISLQGIGVSASMAVQENDSNPIDGVLDFGTIKKGQKKTSGFTIINNGTLPINITSISGIDEPFSSVSPTSFSLTPGQQQTVSILFDGKNRGIFSTQVVISTDKPGITQTLILQGKSISPVLNIDPLSLDFGVANIGSSSIKNVTIFNNGDDSLSITNCGNPPAGFVLGACPSSLSNNAGNNASVALPITFKPTVLQDYSGSITIQTNDGDKSVQLIGVGAGGFVTLSSSTLDFGTIASNTASKTLAMEIKNTGNAPITITNVSTPSAPFTKTQIGIPSIQLLPNTSYSILVTFKPTSAGTFNDQITITTNALNGNQVVKLFGAGVTPDIIITPASGTLGFADTTIDSTSTLSFSMFNNSIIPLNVTNYDPPTSGPFAVTVAKAPGLLNPGDKIDFIVKFKPTTTGSFSGSVNFLFDYASPRSVVFTGNGLAQTGGGGGAIGGVVSISQKQVDFGTVANGTSASVAITVKNTGSSAFNITGITAISANVGTPFTRTFVGATPINIMPGMSYQIVTNFNAPNLAGIYNGVFFINTNALNGNQKVDLFGISAIPIVNVTPTQIAFTATPVGLTNTMNVSIKNNGLIAITITSFNKPDPAAKIELALPGTPLILQPGESEIFLASFTPAASGNYSSVLGIQYDFKTNPVLVNVTGIGVGGTTSPGGGTTGGGGTTTGGTTTTDTTTSSSDSGGGFCFIATAAYGSYLDPNVIVLRNFRDKYLLTNPAGRQFVAFYYKTSPQFAQFIGRHDSLRTATRLALTPVVYGLKYPLFGFGMMLFCGWTVFGAFGSRKKE